MPGQGHVIFLLMAGVVACGSDTSTTGGIPVQIEDSAGVRIVEYVSVPEVEPPFALAAEPRYRHGANQGDYAFQGAGAGRLFPDGGAVVYDEWNIELVVFGPDGSTYQVLATEGEGPGEVGYVRAMFALGQDSILVADSNLGRATLFARGSVVRTTDLPRSGYLAVEGIGSSGDLLLATYWGPSVFEGEWLPGHMIRFDMETGALDTVASYDLNPCIPLGAAVGPDRSCWRGHGRRRALRLHQVRQGGGHLASARRFRNADRPVAGRAGFSDRGVAGAHRGRAPVGGSHAQPRPFRCPDRGTYPGEHGHL